MNKKMKISHNTSKFCSVCGDTATGLNFNAVSCESCKAFFRRNASKDKELQCPFTKQCQITLVTRRFCQRCRLEKCLAVGMKKELIMTDEQKEKKRNKIEANKATKRSRKCKASLKMNAGFDQNESNISDLVLFQPVPSGIQNHGGKTQANPSSVTSDFKTVSASLYSIKTIQDIPAKVFHRKIEITAESVDNILRSAINMEYSFPIHSNILHGSFQQLNDIECAKLNELIAANKELLAPIDKEIGKLVEDLHFMDVINLTAVAIRRLVKMAKQINAFKNMCQEDQVALLKGGCTEMMILRSVVTYDPDKNSWKLPHSQEHIKVDILKEIQGNIYEEHQRFLKTFDPVWRSDENIMVILSALALFTPGRPHVVHHDVIKLEQNSYYYLLRRYLESVYKGCEARSTFLKLIQKMRELHRLNEEHIRVFLNVDPREVEPLLIEIFDLKHR